MLKPYELLKNVLIEIEKKIKDEVNVEILSGLFELSSGHLRRLFKFAFKQTIASYIRSRMLAASLDDLLNTNANVLDIALDYGFNFEQSYIRAFKGEFGITPGELRKSGKIVKVKPPLHLLDENKLSGGVFFGPDIVMVPQFHIIGKSHCIPFADSLSLAPKAAINFWENDKDRIKNIVNPDIYFGLTCNINYKDEHSEYITSAQVTDIDNIPQGFKGFTFRNSLCARFRYIGCHHFYDLNREMAGTMYNAIQKYTSDEQSKYSLLNDKLYFEKIDTGLYDGTYCRLEWYTPVKAIAAF